MSVKNGIEAGQLNIHTTNVSLKQYSDNSSPLTISLTNQEDANANGILENLNPGDVVILEIDIENHGNKSAWYREGLTIGGTAVTDSLNLMALDINNQTTKFKVYSLSANKTATEIKTFATTGTGTNITELTFTSGTDEITYLSVPVILDGQAELGDDAETESTSGAIGSTQTKIRFAIYFAPDSASPEVANQWQNKTFRLDWKGEAIQYRNNQTPDWSEIGVDKVPYMIPLVFTDSVIGNANEYSKHQNGTLGDEGDTFEFPKASKLGKWRVIAVDATDSKKKLIIKELPLSEKEMSGDGQTGNTTPGQAIYFHTKDSLNFFSSATDDGYSRSNLNHSIQNFYQNYIAKSTAKAYVLAVNLQQPTATEYGVGSTYNTWTNSSEFYKGTRFETKHSEGTKQAFALSHGDIHTTMKVPVSSVISPLLIHFPAVTVHLPDNWSYGASSNDYFLRTPGRSYNAPALVYGYASSNTIYAWASNTDPAWPVRPAMWIQDGSDE